MRKILLGLLLLPSLAFGQGIVGSNSTDAPLDNGETYTGSWQTVGPNPAVMFKVLADQSGTMSIDFSDESCTSELNDLDYIFSANIPDVHRVSVSSPCFRITVTNNSGSNQTSMDLVTMMGAMVNLTAPANLSIQNDADAAIVRLRNDPYELIQNLVEGHTVIHKFGANEAIGTTYVPITYGGIYRTPQVAAATTVRIKAGDVLDTAAGTGAREITIVGLDENFIEQTVTLATAGTSASANTAVTFVRIYRAYVSESGRYALATSTGGSHEENVTIENSAGTEDWLTIPKSGFSFSQSEVSAYTVPAGYTAFINTIIVSVDSTKTASVLGFTRADADDAAPPYQAARVFLELGAVSGEEEIIPNTPFGPYSEKTDIVFMAKVPSSTAEVDIDFEIILIEN